MKKLIAYISTSLAVLVVLALPVTSFAAAGSAGLSTTPRKNLIVKPGQSVTDKLTVSNLSKVLPLRVSLSVVDFTYTDQSGSPKFLLAKDASQTTWSLKPFITLPNSVSVAPGQTKVVNYTVKIPKHQGAGSYYSAIFYGTGGQTGGNVSLSATNATLMFVTVPGTVNEKMTLKKLGAFQSKDGGNTGTYAWINLTSPKIIAFTLKNEGDVPEAPNGSIVIKDLWGNQVARIPQANPNQSLALIGQTRRFTTCIKSVSEDVSLSGSNAKETRCADTSLKPGRYTVSMDVFYGQNGNLTREVKSTATFWYIPWWLLVAVAVIILVIIWAVVSVKRRLRKAKSARYKAGRH